MAKSFSIGGPCEAEGAEMTFSGAEASKAVNEGWALGATGAVELGGVPLPPIGILVVQYYRERWVCLSMTQCKFESEVCFSFLLRLTALFKVFLNYENSSWPMGFVVA